VSARRLGALALAACVGLAAAGGCRKASTAVPGEAQEAAGNRAYAAGDFAGAASAYQQAISAGLRLPRVQNNLANALVRDGKLGAAQAAYRAALAADPEYLFATNNLVVALYRGGERDRAWELLTKAQMSWPRVSFFYTTAGYLRHLEGDNAAALKAFQEAIRLNPDSPAALNNYGTLLLESPQADVDPLPYLMRAIEKDPENGLFRDSLGWYYFTKGMFAEATIEIGKAFLYDPKNLEVRVHYATVLEWIGKEKEALEQWTKVLELADDERVKRIAHEHYWDLQGRGVSAAAN
jgi:tetratricopeptide (TPR) repeat protein